jgi:CHAD domain-containing protein
MSIYPIERPGPHDPGAWLDGTELAREFERQALELRRAARRVRRGGDAEAIHDLRVATRHLSAALNLWRDALPADRRLAARRALRRLRRRLGGARELEVMVTMLAEHLAARPAGSEPALEFWLDRLRRRRDMARRRARLLARPRTMQRIVRRIGRAITPLQAPARIPLAGARARLEALRADAGRVLAEAAGEGHDTALHAARITIKKCRYSAEMLARVTRSPVPVELAAWRELQDVMGGIRDRTILRAGLERQWRRWHALAARSLADSLAAESRAQLASLRAAVAPGGDAAGPPQA